MRDAASLGASTTDAGTDDDDEDGYDGGTVVRRGKRSRSGVWVGYYANDPSSETLEIQNVWGNKHRTHVTIPADAVEDVIAALESRI